jgi:hypothetical protein
MARRSIGRRVDTLENERRLRENEDKEELIRNYDEFWEMELEGFAPKVASDSEADFLNEKYLNHNMLWRFSITPLLPCARMNDATQLPARTGRCRGWMRTRVVKFRSSGKT